MGNGKNFNTVKSTKGSTRPHVGETKPLETVGGSRNGPDQSEIQEHCRIENCLRFIPSPTDEITLRKPKTNIEESQL